MIIATLLVRDEIDIVKKTIEFHLNNGVDRYFITDNCSTDGTYKLLQAYSDVADIACEDGTRFYQSTWVNRMFNKALELKPDWIINLDSDEFWHGLPTLYNVPSEIDIVKARFIQHWPYPDMPFHDWDMNKGPTSEWPHSKVAVRGKPGYRISIGNHEVVDRPSVPWPDLVIHHYCIRSYAQFVQKIMTGGAVLEASNEPDTTADHWRYWYSKYREGSLRQVYDGIVRTQTERGV